MAAFVKYGTVQDPPKSTAELVYGRAQLLYPAILLAAFGISLVAYCYLTARTEEELIEATVAGPGGKPLPATKRKREEIEEPLESDESPADSTSNLVIRRLTVAVILTFFADIAVNALHLWNDSQSLPNPQYEWWNGENRTVYLWGAIAFYGYALMILYNWTPCAVHLVIWSVGFVAEAIIFTSFICFLLGQGPANAWPGGEDSLAKDPVKFVRQLDQWCFWDLGIGGVRLGFVCFLAGFCGLLLAKGYLRKHHHRDEESDLSDLDERSPLLDSNGNGNSANYHTQTNGRTAEDRTGDDANNTKGFVQPDANAAFYRPDKLPQKTWFEYCRGYVVFFPYLWPSESLKLQIYVLLCFIILVLQRAVNVLWPEQVHTVVRILRESVGADSAQSGSIMALFSSNAADSESEQTSVWFNICLLVVYKFLQSQSGLFGYLKQMLWLPVSQYTYRALTTASFEHVHSLSLDFHLGKRTGEVLSALNKGGSINQFLDQVTFSIIPTMFDLVVACVYFYNKLGPSYALIVTVVTFYYVYLTIGMAEKNISQRREMVNADREETAVKNDSIMSYETVKYFNAEGYEFKRYGDAVGKFQKHEAEVTRGINQTNLTQSVIFLSGMLVALMTCTYEILQKQKKVDDLVMLLSYLQQLQGPLTVIGSFYRSMQQSMISGERLLELFKIQPTVVDQPHVKTLRECNGRITWSKVGFSYDDRKPALQDLTFECPPGTTTAFVGESGGGKSTIFRLMFRYYNCHEGRIQIDGQDVKDLTMDSVRRFIGVVPQDTILFNETLMYNLKYANPAATDDDVYEACKAAAIHDRIMSFPDGYSTKVGERGLRLSGGEKQRVAIARTILKNPRIIMLDEATSALDGETEQKIQAKLISGNFGNDRTLLIIAHRLSTITHADQIVVLHAGNIVEKGTHLELLALNGRYAKMWEKHCKAERAEEQARDATRKAKKLLCQANISRGSEVSDGYSSMVSSTILPTGMNSPVGIRSIHDSSSDTSQRDNDSISSRSSSSGSEHTLQDDENGGGGDTRQDEMADDEYSPGDEVDERTALLPGSGEAQRRNDGRN